MKLHWLVTFVCAGVAAAAEPPARAELPDYLRLTVAEEPGEMPGRVIDPDGRPIAGAVVRLRCHGLGADKPDLASAVTDADGRFVLDRKFRLTTTQNLIWAYLLVAHPDWALAAEMVSRVPDELAVQLERGGEATVHLRSPDATTAGARMIPLRQGAVSLPADLRESLTVTADADGRCVLRHVPTRGLTYQVDDRRFVRETLDVSFDHRSVARLSRQNRVLAPADSDGALSIDLEPGSSIRTRVVIGATGEPVEDVRVSADAIGDTRGGGSAYSDADGRVEIWQLAAGNYNLLVHLDEAMRDEWTAAAVRDVVVPYRATAATVPIRLTRGAVVHGRVTAPEGQTLPALMDVAVHGPSRPSEGATDSRPIDAEGRFTFRVPPGLNFFYIRDETFRQQPVPDPREIDLVEGEEVELEFVLGANPPLRGAVLAADGEPVADARLLIVRPGRSVGLGGWTDAEGNFELETRLFHQDFELWAFHGTAGSLAPVRHRPGEDEPLELVLGPGLSAAAEGIILWPDQRPAARLSLTVQCLVDARWQQIGNGRTNRTGQFRVDCPPVGPLFRIIAREAQVSRATHYITQPFRARPGEVVELPIWTLTDESEWVR